MKQRLITAACLLAVLAVVVWQINTPVLLIAVAFLSAVASGEIMKCAKVENTFIRVVGIIFSACFQLFASAKLGARLLTLFLISFISSFCALYFSLQCSRITLTQRLRM